MVRNVTTDCKQGQPVVGLGVVGQNGLQAAVQQGVSLSEMEASLLPEACHGRLDSWTCTGQQQRRQ